MEEELKRKVKMAAKQIVEVKKYAKLYQDNFRKQADEYIKVLKQETVEKNQNQENNLNMSLKKVQELITKIEDGDLDGALDYLKNEKGDE